MNDICIFLEKSKTILELNSQNNSIDNEGFERLLNLLLERKNNNENSNLSVVTLRFEKNDISENLKQEILKFSVFPLSIEL